MNKCEICDTPVSSTFTENTVCDHCLDIWFEFERWCECFRQQRTKDNFKYVFPHENLKILEWGIE